MLPVKFVHITVVEGFSNHTDKVVNVDHIIQFEPSLARPEHSNIFLSDGKVLLAAESFHKLIEKFNNNKYAV
jgi:hypothetical protein